MYNVHVNYHDLYVVGMCLYDTINVEVYTAFVKNR